MKYLVRQNFKFDKHDNYILFFASTPDQAMTMQSEIEKHEGNDDLKSLVKYFQKVLEEKFYKGQVYDFEKNKLVDMTKEDIKDLPIGILKESIKKVLGTNLKVS